MQLHPSQVEWVVGFGGINAKQRQRMTDRNGGFVTKSFSLGCMLVIANTKLID